MKNKKLFAILTLLCFMFTLMPVAAFAAVTEPTLGGVDVQESAVFTEDENASEDVDDAVSIHFDLVDAQGYTVGVATGTVYVWFVKDGADVATTSVSSNDAKAVGNGVFKIASPESGVDYDFVFANSGTYTVKAAAMDPNKVDEKTLAAKFSNVDYKLGGVASHREVEITSSSSSRDYGIQVTLPSGVDFVETPAGTIYDGDEIEIDGIDTNGVYTGNIVLKLVDKDGKAVKGETITLDTNSSSIELNKDKATTDQLGQIKFKIAGVKDGEYKIYVKCGSYESTIVVNVGGIGAATIKVVKSPSAPIDVTSDLGNKIQFTFTDANGNAVTAARAEIAGATHAFDAKDNGGYVSIVSQPAASDLDNEDFYLDAADDNEYRANLALADGADELEEGTYEIKVVLNSGKYVYVTFEVAEFGTPVSLVLTYEADAVEIGSYVEIDDLKWVDANGVTKDATGKVDLAASGYAIERFFTEKDECGVVGCDVEHGIGTVLVKDDDKYVGQTITVVAVDDRYNLTAEVKLAVADEATALEFDADTLAVDVNNKIDVAVVDGSGNKVALNRAKDATITYVILDKPEGAKVSATTDESDNDILEEGTFVMNLTSNKVGNVTVQAVAKVTQEDGVVKYYSGTEIFAIGTEGTGSVVVMSIGSNQIIINDAKATIDAAPIVANNRTFVPFRALAEAFGATVAYDEATQAVTAELNGTTVVMTIGSATYTVNGAEKTADVAPFINGSRTMVPVRFAAEAFGIKVIPTYDENGATADILFNL